MIERRVFDEFDDNIARKEKELSERLTYGIATTDAWNLNSHLIALLANGLEVLRALGHSFPARFSGQVRGAERWNNELERIQRLCVWIYDYEEHESALYEYYFPDDSGIEASDDANDKANEDRKEFHLASEALAQRRQQLLDIVLEWLSANFFDLWD